MTFIAFYHYVRIFNSWVDSYEFPASKGGAEASPTLTGKPFNDAYRYMDWLLTVPLLLIEILLVMKLSEEEFGKKAWTLGLGSALMIASGYYALRDVMAQIMKFIEEEQSRGVIRTSPHREKRRWKVRLN